MRDYLWVTHLQRRKLNCYDLILIVQIPPWSVPWTILLMFQSKRRFNYSFQFFFFFKFNYLLSCTAGWSCAGGCSCCSIVTTISSIFATASSVSWSREIFTSTSDASSDGHCVRGKVSFICFRHFYIVFPSFAFIFRTATSIRNSMLFLIEMRSLFKKVMLLWWLNMLRRNA